MRKFFTALLLLVAVGFAVAGDITDKGWTQRDLYQFLSNVVTGGNSIKSGQNLLLTSTRNQFLGYPGFTASATASAPDFILTATVTAYLINDAMYTVSADTHLEVATAPAEQVATTSCIYLVSIDSSGLYTWTKGTNVAYGSTPSAPAVPANTAPLAEIKVDLTGAASSFTLGTTPLDAAGTTTTITSVRWPRTGSNAIASLTFTDLTLSGL